MILRLLDRLRLVLFSTIGIRTLGAMALAIDDDGRLVLIRQTYGSPVWTMPGGGVHRTESFREAAIREAQEEAGITLRADGSAQLLGVYLRPRGRWMDHVAVYVLRGFDVEAVKSREVAEVSRFARDALPSALAGSVQRRLTELDACHIDSDRW